MASSDEKTGARRPLIVRWLGAAGPAVTLRTEIPIEECRARLAAGVDVERLAFSWSGHAGSKPILGKFSETGFRLQKRRYYRNEFAPFFYGRFVSAYRGTVIEGEFRMRPFVRAFIVIWFSFLVFYLAIALIQLAMGRPGVQEDRVPLLLVPLCMMAFGVALVMFGRWLGRGEERAIVAFLKSTFEANEAAMEANTPGHQS